MSVCVCREIERETCPQLARLLLSLRAFLVQSGCVSELPSIETIRCSTDTEFESLSSLSNIYNATLCKSSGAEADIPSKLRYYMETRRALDGWLSILDEFKNSKKRAIPFDPRVHKCQYSHAVQSRSRCLADA